MGRKCTVFGCGSSRDVRLFSVPENINDEWWRVISYRKAIAWRPKKSTVICALHFNKNQIVGQKLLPEAIPTINGAEIAVKNGKFSFLIPRKNIICVLNCSLKKRYSDVLPFSEVHRI